MDVFDKLDNARTNGKSVSLSFADVEFLYELLGEELANAGAACDTWRERFARSTTASEAAKSPTADLAEDGTGENARREGLSGLG